MHANVETWLNVEFNQTSNDIFTAVFSGPLTLEGAASTTSQNVVEETASFCTQYPTRTKISISDIYILIGSLVEIR